MCKAIDDIYNEGVLHGVSDGISQGIDIHRINLVRTKLAKGQTTTQIADALEEDVDTIEDIIFNKIKDNELN